MLQIRSAAREQGRPLRVMHLAELLDRSIRGEPVGPEAFPPIES
jgi:hypothetical protein